MTKTDTSLKQNIKDIIKMLKKMQKISPSKKKKQNGGNDDNDDILPFYSCVKQGYIPIDDSKMTSKWFSGKFNSFPKTQLVTKILTDGDKYNEELEIAKYIDSNPERESRLLYPIGGCVIPNGPETQAILSTCPENKRMINNKFTFDKNTTGPIYLLYIEKADYTFTDFINAYHQGQGQRQLSDDELVQIFDDILSGINQMHSIRITHNDIQKPSNIMIKNNRGYIIDFGEATHFDGSSDDITRINKDIESAMTYKNPIANEIVNPSIKRCLTSLNLQTTITAIILKLNECISKLQTTPVKRRRDDDDEPESPVRGLVMPDDESGYKTP
jgi:serine/threonine protein kinase